MAKFEVLKTLVVEKGTEVMKAWVFSAEKIQKGFEKVFFEKDVSDEVLMEYLSILFEEQKEDEFFKGNKYIKAEKSMRNVLYIVRHTWELKDKYGKIKTGNDLFKAIPHMFEGLEMLDTEALFKELEAMA